jgi:transketolase
VVEILAVLFFRILRLDPSNPGWSTRDRFLVSKGHASAAMYVAMAWRGFFPRERLFDSFNRAHSILQEHVNMDTPGAEIPTGSLGMGLSAGAGMAWGGRYRAQREGGPPVGVFAVLSDGECTAGQTWEAFGWHVVEVDGHDLPAVIDALETARRPETAPGKPRLVIAHTVKGKGVSFMEASDGWHAGHLTADQYQAALAEVTR